MRMIGLLCCHPSQTRLVFSSLLSPQMDYQVLCTVQEVLTNVWPGVDALDIVTDEISALVLKRPVLTAFDVEDVMLSEEGPIQRRTKTLILQILMSTREMNYEFSPRTLVEIVKARIATTFFRNESWSQLSISPTPELDDLIQRTRIDPNHIYHSEDIDTEDRALVERMVEMFETSLNKPPRDETDFAPIDLPEDQNTLNIPTWFVPNRATVDLARSPVRPDKRPQPQSPKRHQVDWVLDVPMTDIGTSTEYPKPTEFRAIENPRWAPGEIVGVLRWIALRRGAQRILLIGEQHGATFKHPNVYDLVAWYSRYAVKPFSLYVEANPEYIGVPSGGMTPMDKLIESKFRMVKSVGVNEDLKYFKTEDGKLVRFRKKDVPGIYDIDRESVYPDGQLNAMRELANTDISLAEETTWHRWTEIRRGIPRDRARLMDEWLYQDIVVRKEKYGDFADFKIQRLLVDVNAVSLALDDPNPIVMVLGDAHVQNIAHGLIEYFDFEIIDQEVATQIHPQTHRFENSGLRAVWNPIEEPLGVLPPGKRWARPIIAVEE